MAKLKLKAKEWEWVSNNERKARQMGLYGQEVFRTGAAWGWCVLDFSADEGICSNHQCLTESAATEQCDRALLDEIEKVVEIEEE